jgi:hypothetical protein
LEKHSRWSWLRKCQECAKLSKEKGGYFDLFNTFWLLHDFICAIS